MADLLARDTALTGAGSTGADPARRAVRVRVTGVVQGVGFRPFVHRLATSLELAGIVGNDAGAVFVEVEGAGPGIDGFIRRLSSDAPPLAVIDDVDIVDVAPTSRTEFAIVGSRTAPGPVTAVSPDTAVCDACLAELWDPANRRHLHPFITCTDCGPRFTITRRLPYDRPGTTMEDFPLCPACTAEYGDPGDRRYHAQPIGCHDCGPHITLRLGTGPPLVRNKAIAAAREALADGAILAVKGIGGYHLVCDAASDAATGALRQRKGRADKPFAVMVADLADAERLAVIDSDSAHLLGSPARPIVLLTARPGPLSPLVAPGNPLIGILTAYTPLHHLLLRDRGPLVVTSTNRSGEPICYRDDDLASRLGLLSDGILGHDRPIHVPCDDSVVRVNGGTLLPVRRSRGYAPLPVRVPAGHPDALAVGGELKNTFCVATQGRAWMSQHIGDLANLETLAAFEASVAQFCELYRVRPRVVAVDAHPGYLGSRWARARWPESVTEVQHHHAHVASVIAEHGLDPEEPVIGVAFDGTGYGDDGTVWGGEILEATATGYRRIGHLAPVPLPGGDAAVAHPWRMALAHLRAAGAPWDTGMAPARHAGELALGVIDRQLATGVACVPTTSMGRLFDAVASLLGLRHDITYEAQAAIELEHLAACCDTDPPTLTFGHGPEGTFDAGPVILGLLDAVSAETPPAAIALGFHRAVVDAVAGAVEAAGERTGTTVVALSGGVWQNALLTRLATTRLLAGGFDVRTNRLVPPNDGGLALGQILVATRRAALHQEARPCVSPYPAV